MQVLFINPPYKASTAKIYGESNNQIYTNSNRIYYPIWLLYAAGVLLNSGFDVKFIDAAAKHLNSNQIESLLKNFNPRLIVINLLANTKYDDILLAEKIKTILPKTFVIMVGSYPSEQPIEVLKLGKKIDAVARYEYDYTLRDLAFCLKNNKNLNDVNGITFREDNEIIYNKNRELIDNLDELPFISMSIKHFIRYQDYFVLSDFSNEIQIVTGRLGAFNCPTSSFPQIFCSENYRLRSIQNILNEFEYIINNFPDVKEIGIVDDTFTAIEERVIEFCYLLISRELDKKIRWNVNARMTLDSETIKLMKSANCRLIIPTPES